MPRGFKVDRYETEKAYEEGRLSDRRKRSFIAIGGCELLFGVDKTRRRSEIEQRDKGLCQGCARPHYIGSMGEWDHIRGGLSGRCDCLHNGRWVCAAFHRKRHVQVMLGRIS